LFLDGLGVMFTASPDPEPSETVNTNPDSDHHQNRRRLPRYLRPFHAPALRHRGQPYRAQVSMRLSRSGRQTAPGRVRRRVAGPLRDGRVQILSRLVWQLLNGQVMYALDEWRCDIERAADHAVAECPRINDVNREALLRAPLIWWYQGRNAMRSTGFLVSQYASPSQNGAGDGDANDDQASFDKRLLDDVDPDDESFFGTFRGE
ncbi:hypothetical protein BVRB_024290, partial [Beta vulgaris subsp. vulgaris]